ncbi:Acyl-CoA binding domain containing 5 [Branchiostoma belcheri]|nr:Acyl-CoA binding domain containing 5 [Branchiostoma belcheri]
MAATQARFDAAVKVIQSLPKNGSITPSHETMLTFYAYYKQATIGPCDISRPGFWDVVGRAKWEAWNRLGNMPKEEAMDNYVDTLKKIIEALPQDKEMQDFMHVLGPFYELVDLETPFQSGKSSPNQSELSISDQPVLAIKENGEIPTNHIGETLDDLQTNNNKNTENQQTILKKMKLKLPIRCMEKQEDWNAGRRNQSQRGGCLNQSDRRRDSDQPERSRGFDQSQTRQGRRQPIRGEGRIWVEVEEVMEEVQPGKGIFAAFCWWY